MGIFADMMRDMVLYYQTEREIGWEWQSIDSKSCPAPLGGEQTGRNPTDRGKQGSKIHLLVDEKGAPLSLHITGANEHDKWSDQPGLIWTNVPLCKDDEIFLSMGYDYPAKMLKINGDKMAFEEVYTDTVFDNHHHGMIELDGYIYGSNWENNRKGNWLCKNWETGEIAYDTPWNTKGAMVYADGQFNREDLFQEICLQLWRSYPNFRNESKFSTWMYRVALNTAISAIRKTKTELHFEQLHDNDRIETEPSDEKEQVKLLYRAISKLNRIDKALILLWLEEKSYDEIAAIMGTTKGNVSVKLVRIKRKLEELVSETEKQES